MLGALAVLFLFLGGVLPLALYACPLLASVCLLPVREECRASYQWCCFFAAAILGLLLGPDKESALLFCFLGYYLLLLLRTFVYAAYLCTRFSLMYPCYTILNSVTAVLPR